MYSVQAYGKFRRRELRQGTFFPLLLNTRKEGERNLRIFYLRKRVKVFADSTVQFSAGVFNILTYFVSSFLYYFLPPQYYLDTRNTRVSLSPKPYSYSSLSSPLSNSTLYFYDTWYKLTHTHTFKCPFLFSEVRRDVMGIFRPSFYVYCLAIPVRCKNLFYISTKVL